MTTTVFLAIRATHVLMAALWLGATVFTSTLLMPAVDAAGPSGGQVMQRLNRHGLHLYMTVLSLTTVLTGVYLLWRFTGGFDQSVSASVAGLAFGAGGAAGILAGIIGGGVVGRTGKKLATLLAQTFANDDEAGRRAQMRQVDTLKLRMKVGTRVVIALQTTALVFMAIGHYV
jgi:hypothetical protein